MQTAVIEFARNVGGLEGAHSGEFAPEAPDLVIDLMPDQKGVVDKGGTMRLGAWPCSLKKGTLARRVYGADDIRERHRHRYEVSNAYRARLEEAGLTLSGQSPDSHLVEIVELEGHPWFLGCQFHPEFKSRPTSPHPLFKSFVGAARAHRDED